MRNFVYKSEIECPTRALYAWHLRPWAFERLTPPWLDVHVKDAPQRLEKGLKIALTVRKLGILFECRFTITDLETDKYFADQQVRGPFAFWRHEHKFEVLSAERSLMNDDIRYSMPLGFVSEHFLASFIEKDLQRMFRYRHEILKHDLAAYMRNSEHPRQNVFVSGDWSRLCQPLVSYLSTQGHSVIAESLQKAERNPPEHYESVGAYINVCDWGAQSPDVDARALDALRFSKNLKVYIEIHDAYKGDNSNEFFDRRCEPLRAASVRCVYIRTGAILTPAFGVLKNNPQWRDETQPWIAVDDAISAIEFCMLNESISGQIHMTANQKKAMTKELKPMLDAQYPFRYSTMKSALKHVLGT